MRRLTARSGQSSIRRTMELTTSPSARGRCSRARENTGFPSRSTYLDVADHVDTRASVDVGGSIAGRLDLAYDRDWFAVTLEASKTYRFDLEGSPTNQGTLEDPYLHGIYDSGGILIWYTIDDNNGRGADLGRQRRGRRRDVHAYPQQRLRCAGRRCRGDGHDPEHGSSSGQPVDSRRRGDRDDPGQR